MLSHTALRNVFRGHMCVLPGGMEGLVSSGSRGEGCQLFCGKKESGEEGKERDSSA